MKMFVPLVILALSANAAHAARSCNLYSDSSFSKGRFTVLEGRPAPSMYGFDNQASAAVVSHGCRMTVYQEGGFAGDSRILTGIVGQVDGIWNDRISSARCDCDDYALNAVPAVGGVARPSGAAVIRQLLPPLMDAISKTLRR